MAVIDALAEVSGWLAANRSGRGLSDEEAGQVRADFEASRYTVRAFCEAYTSATERIAYPSLADVRRRARENCSTQLEGQRKVERPPGGWPWEVAFRERYIDRHGIDAWEARAQAVWEVDRSRDALQEVIEIEHGNVLLACGHQVSLIGHGHDDGRRHRRCAACGPHVVPVHLVGRAGETEGPGLRLRAG